MGLQELVPGVMATLAATVIGSGAVIWEARTGRDHDFNKLDSKIEAVQSKLESDITELQAKIQDLRANLQATQSMILETSFHTMRAIDGNKAPLREWVRRIERCRKSGGNTVALCVRETQGKGGEGYAAREMGKWENGDLFVIVNRYDCIQYEINKQNKLWPYSEIIGDYETGSSLGNVEIVGKRLNFTRRVH